ncbi:energy transducer TonB [Povalibacter sp.]|uniref:energy transducer TonB n=1 Tax=Povalibacter sp. TaxID=1962978 RepID=UPI002F3F3AE1
MNTVEFDTRLRHQRRSERPAQPQLQAVVPSPITITVQSTDQELCEAIRAAAGNQHPVSVASSMDEATQLAADGKCGILITDQALTQQALVQIGKQMRVYDPAAITIAVGSRGDDNALIGLLSSAVVERFMLKPVTPALARLVIRSAASEYQSLKYRARRAATAPQPGPHDMQSGDPVVVPMPSAPAAKKPEASISPPMKAADPAQEETRVALASVLVEPRAAASLVSTAPSRFGPSSSVWLIAAAAAVIVGLAVWWTMQSRVPDIDPRQVIATNLTAGRQAIDGGRYVDPPESSALHYYSVVLSLDPANADARRGMETVADRMVEDVKLAIVDGRLAEAGIGLERLRRISPDNRRLVMLDSELRQEQAKQIALLQAPPPAVVEQKPKQTSSKAPLRATVPMAEESAAVTGTAFVSNSAMKSPLDMGPPAPASLGEPPAAMPAAVSGSGAAIDPGSVLPSTAMVPAAAAGLAAASAGNSHSDSSASQPAASQSAAGAGPKLVKMVQPDFPKDARERNVQGWVDLTLAVTAAGQVSSAQVTSAENGRFFERAAVAAAKQWRYEPQPLADPATMRPVRVRVSFRLQD